MWATATPRSKFFREDGLIVEYDPKETNDYPKTGETVSRRSLPTDLNVPSFRKTGDVVRAVLRLYRDNFLSLLKIVAVLIVPLITFQYVFLRLSEITLANITIQLFSLVGESLMSGVLIYAVVSYLRQGTFPALSESYAWGLKRWGKVFACSFLFRVIIIFGFVMLIVPGIIFSLMFALVVPIVVVEDAPVLASFTRSRDLTRNYRLQIFCTYFVFTLIIFLIALVTNIGFGGNATTESSLPLALVQGLIAQLLESSSIVLTLFIYLGILRDAKQVPTDAGDATGRSSQVETGREF